MSGANAATPSLQAFLDAFNAHDVDAIMSFFTEDCVFDTPRGPAPGGRRLVGKEQVRSGIQARFDGIPDIRLRRRPPLDLAATAACPSGRSEGRRRRASPSRCAAATCSSSPTAGSAGRTPSGRSSTERRAARRCGRPHSRRRERRRRHTGSLDGAVAPRARSCGYADHAEHVAARPRQACPARVQRPEQRHLSAARQRGLVLSRASAVPRRPPSRWSRRRSATGRGRRCPGRFRRRRSGCAAGSRADPRAPVRSLLTKNTAPPPSRASLPSSACRRSARGSRRRPRRPRRRSRRRHAGRAGLAPRPIAGAGEDTVEDRPGDADAAQCGAVAADPAR